MNYFLQLISQFYWRHEKLYKYEIEIINKSYLI